MDKFRVPFVNVTNNLTVEYLSNFTAAESVCGLKKNGRKEELGRLIKHQRMT